MALPSSYRTGTASVSSSVDPTIVTGQGTLWLNAIRPGDVFWGKDGVSVSIASVDTNTQLTLAFAWPGDPQAVEAYEIRITPDTARMQEQTRIMLEKLSALDANSQGLFFVYSSNTANSDPGAGVLRFNHATLASATALYIDLLDANSPNRSVTSLISTWGAGTSLIFRSLETTAFVAFSLAGPLDSPAGFRRATGMTYIGGDGVITNGEPVSVGWFGVGQGLKIDAVGTLAGRATYDGAAAGFVYLAVEAAGSIIYRKNSATSADWSAGAPLQGVAGYNGWSPTFGLASDGDRRVLKLLAYVGGTGTAPAIVGNQYVAAAGYTTNIALAIDVRGALGLKGDSGLTGDQGDAGWAPVFGLAADGARIVMQVTGYAGGEGTVPTAHIGQYLAVGGFTSTIADALDVRGAQGDKGDTGDAGTDPGLLYSWSTTTTDANPGAGVIRASSGVLAGSLTLYVSKLGRTGDDVSTWLATMASAANPIKGTLVLSRSGGNAFCTMNVTGITDATGYVKVAVTDADGVANFDTSDAVSLQFMRSGSAGAGDGDVKAAGPAVLGRLAMFTQTDGKEIGDSGLPVDDILLGDDNLSTVASPVAALDNLSTKGTDIASAATLNLDAATGALVEISGTTATSIVTLGAGKRRRVRAAAAWPITVGASLLLNTVGNYTCAAGDEIEFVGYGAFVRGTVFPVTSPLARSVMGKATSADMVDGIGVPGYQPPAYTGQVANGCRMPINLKLSNQQIQSRTRHLMKDTVSSFKLVFPNWYVGSAEGGSGGTGTLTASVEYPVGVFTQVKFAASASGSFASGADLTSDDLLSPPPAGTEFWVRSLLIVSAGGVPYSQKNFGSVAEYAASGLTDKTMSGTIVDNGDGTDDAYGPIAIVGSTRKPSFALVGDSRVHGNDDVADATMDIGTLQRSLGEFGSMVLAKSGSTVAQMLASSTRRTALSNAYASHVLISYGVNDLAGGRTAAQLKTDTEALIALFPAKKVYVATIEPVSTSSNGFVDEAGQTTAAYNAARVTFNASVRSGLAGAAGYIELADSLETARNSGKWLSPGFTDDGVHAGRKANLWIRDSFAINTDLFKSSLARPPKLATPTQVAAGVSSELAATPAGVKEAYGKEGLWTPVPRGSTTPGAPTGTFIGKYVRVGPVVHVWGQVSFTALGGMAGNLIIGGLPFTSWNSFLGRGGVLVGLRTGFATGFPIGGDIVANTTDIRMLREGIDNTPLGVSSLTAISGLNFQATYLAA